jgi:hypothetical protein
VNVLAASLKTAGGEDTIYRRGNDSIDVTGVPVRVRHDEYGNEGNFTSRERDWLYLAEDLTHDGQRWEPQRGDEIDWINPLGVKHTYQVLPRLDDRCFRFSDTTLQLLRVYTLERIPNSE